jgi:hypothetical protein
LAKVLKLLAHKSLEAPHDTTTNAGAANREDNFLHRTTKQTLPMDKRGLLSAGTESLDPFTVLKE